MKTTVTPEAEGWLKKRLQQIVDACAGLAAAEARHSRDAARATQEKTQYYAELARLDTDDAQAVERHAARRARVAVLEDKVGNPAMVKAAIQSLASALQSVLPDVRNACQLRDPDEYAVSVSVDSLGAELMRLHTQPSLAEQSATVVRVAGTVQGAIHTLLRGRKRAPLTREERETGNLKDGNSVVRRLTFNEQMTGQADT